MSHLVDPQTPLVSFRRHSDPPNLWLNVLAASVLLHAIALWVVRPALVQLSLQPSARAPVPVSLIEVPPSQSSPTALVQPAAATSRSRTGERGRVAPSRIASAKSGVPRPATAAMTSTQQIQVSRTPAKLRHILPKTLKRSPKPAFPLKPDIAPTPLSRAPVPPSQPRGEGPTPSVPPATPPLPSTPPVPPPQSSGSPTSVPPATPPLPSPPAPPSPPVKTLPPLPVPQNGSVEAQLVGNPRSGATDLHKHLAEPDRNTKPVNSLIYLQRIQQNRGKPVEFEVQLIVDAAGNATVRRVTPLSGQASSDLRDFADELFKDWKFKPAYDDNPNMPVASDLIVQVRVNNP